MRRAVVAAVVLVAALATASCAPGAPGTGPGSSAGSPSAAASSTSPSTTSPSTTSSTTGADDDGATHEDFCLAVHVVEQVTAQETTDGVLLTWLAGPHPFEPGTYVVHRRPAGTQGWDRVEEVSRPDEDLTYLDVRPAEQPDVAYEYAVTTIEPECGGESEICPERECDPPPAATPRQS